MYVVGEKGSAIGNVGFRGLLSDSSGTAITCSDCFVFQGNVKVSIGSAEFLTKVWGSRTFGLKG